VEQRLEHAALVHGKLALEVHEMQEPGIEAGDVIDPVTDCGEEFLEPEIRDRGSAAEYEHV
jgi:hypothetical protein